MGQNTLLLFLIASVTLTVFPGPDILFVLSTSLTRGWKRGFEVSLGLCTGLIVHTLVVVFGIGSLLQKIPESIRFIELAGASYFLYLSYQLWKSTKSKTKDTIGAEKENRLFVTGFIMNLSNPKVSLFFLSFFPGFLFSEDLNYSLQFLILGALFLLQALFVFSLSAYLVDRLGEKVRPKENAVFWNRIQSLILLFIALVLIYP